MSCDRTIWRSFPNTLYTGHGTHNVLPTYVTGRGAVSSMTICACVPFPSSRNIGTPSSLMSWRLESSDRILWRVNALLPYSICSMPNIIQRKSNHTVLAKPPNWGKSYSDSTKPTGEILNCCKTTRQQRQVPIQLSKAHGKNVSVHCPCHPAQLPIQGSYSGPMQCSIEAENTQVTHLEEFYRAGDPSCTPRPRIS